MGDITKKSTATLIDELITVSQKIFWALEKASEAEDMAEIGKHYGMAQRLNSKRSKLIAAIDARFGEESTEEKTY